MKVCIPAVNSEGLKAPVSEHFGSAPYFVIVDTDSQAAETLANPNEHHDHGSCHPMGTLAGRGVTAVACGGMGKRAVESLNAGGVRVYLTQGETVGDVVADFNSGRCPELRPDQACAGHGCH